MQLFFAPQASFLERDAEDRMICAAESIKVPVVDVQRQPDETEDLNAIQAKFKRATFDFVNRIGPKLTWRDVRIIASGQNRTPMRHSTFHLSSAAAFQRPRRGVARASLRKRAKAQKWCGR